MSVEDVTVHNVLIVKKEGLPIIKAIAEVVFLLKPLDPVSFQVDCLHLAQDSDYTLILDEKQSKVVY